MLAQNLIFQCSIYKFSVYPDNTTCCWNYFHSSDEGTLSLCCFQNYLIVSLLIRNFFNPFSLTLVLRSKKTSYIYVTGYILYPYFFKISFATFFRVRLIDSAEVKTVFLFRFFNFHSIIWSEIDKIFEDKKIYFTTAVIGANVTWLQNMCSLFSQLCSRVAHGDSLAIIMC
jgi:hypothetical protein